MSRQKVYEVCSTSYFNYAGEYSSSEVKIKYYGYKYSCASCKNDYTLTELATKKDSSNINKVRYYNMDNKQLIEAYELKSNLLGMGGINLFEHGGVVFANYEEGDKSVAKIIIPNFVNIIEEIGFIGCINVKELMLPTSLTEIHMGAFGNWISLKEIAIPVNVILIEDRAFDYCRRLEVINIEANDISIEEGAFSNCESLHTVNIRGGKVRLQMDNFYGSGNKSTGLIENVNIECDSLEIEPNVFDNFRKIRALKKFKYALAEYGNKVELY